MFGTRKIEVDGAAFTDKKATHAALRAAIGSEDYVGSNLDALNDVLTSICKKTRITVKNFNKAEEQLEDYAQALAATLASAASANPYLTVVFE